MSHLSTRLADAQGSRPLWDANARDYHALPEDGVTPSYCLAPHRGGQIAKIEETTPTVWVCAGCGRITDRCTNDSKNSWRLDEPSTRLDLSEWVVIRGRATVGEVAEPVALIDSPYAAKEDIKGLPFQATERRWSDELNSWVIGVSAESRFIEHMRSRGWNALNLAQITLRGYGD